jgi:hypothetical protein
MSKKYSWELDEAKTLSKSRFPIKPVALIARAKQVIDKDILDADDLSEDFVFQFPVVGPLSKAEYLKAVGGFQIKSMFPDLNLGIHNFHVDPLQPNRVWYVLLPSSIYLLVPPMSMYIDSLTLLSLPPPPPSPPSSLPLPLPPYRYTVCFTARNSGDGPFGAATNIQVDCPPQVNSLSFNERGQVVKYTGGYVVDKDVGNSGGMGGLFGPLYVSPFFPFLSILSYLLLPSFLPSLPLSMYRSPYVYVY